MAGNGSPTYNGDDIPATLAGIDPVSVAVVPAGVLGADELLVIADYGNNRIREVDLTTGLITTVAGSGIPEQPGGGGGYGDGGPATTAELFQPTDVAVDEYGHLFIVDNAGGAFVREVNLTTSAVTVPSDTLPGGVLEPGEIASVTNTTLTGQFGGLTGYGGGLFMAVNPSGTDLYVGGPFSTQVEVVDLATGEIDPFSDIGYNSVDNYYGADALAVDGNGDVFIGSAGGLYEFSSSGQYVQQCVEPGGTVTAVQAMATNAAGNAYAVTDQVGERTLESSPAGATFNPVTFSGNGDGGPAQDAAMAPQAVVADTSGNLFVADAYVNGAVDGGGEIRKVDATTCQITAIAGNGTSGFSGDGGPAISATFGNASGIALDEQDDVLFVADAYNDAVREINLSSTNSVTLPNSDLTNGVAGSGQNATLAPGDIATILSGPENVGGVSLDLPNCLAYDQNRGVLYITGFGDNQVFEYNPSTTAVALPNGSSLGAGAMATVAGNGTAGYNGDGLAATAELNGPTALAVDGAGNLYVSDSYNNLVREINLTGSPVSTPGGATIPVGNIATIAGNYTLGAGSSGENIAATAAQLNNPIGLAIDGAGDVFIADTHNGLIREVYAGTGANAGQIATVAGLGTSGVGDGGSALDALLNEPFGLSFDSAGDLLVADFGDGRVREILSGEQVSVQAGTTTSINAPATPQVYGELLTATVAWNEPGSPPPSANAAPTGMVEFFDQNTGALLGTAPLTPATGTSSTASFPISALPLGNDTITATYLGDANYTGSASGNAAVTVNAISPSTLETAIGSASNITLQFNDSVDLQNAMKRHPRDDSSLEPALKRSHHHRSGARTIHGYRIQPTRRGDPDHRRYVLSGREPLDRRGRLSRGHGIVRKRGPHELDLDHCHRFANVAGQWRRRNADE